MDPTRLHAFMTQPSSVATAATLKPTNSRQAKRLLLSNLPPTSDEESLLQFFNQSLSSLNVVTGSPDPITSAQLSSSKDIGLLEFKNTNDATVCLALSGIVYKGAKVDIKRPKDYIVPLVADDSGHHEPGVISSNVPDTPNKILVSQIPDYLQDEQVIELLKSFGDLKAFILVKDTTDDVSKVQPTPDILTKIKLMSPLHSQNLLKKNMQGKKCERKIYSVSTNAYWGHYHFNFSIAINL